MKKLQVPEGHGQIMLYLILKRAPEFIDFMQKVFGAEEFVRKMRDDKSIMHAEIVIGDSTLMIAECTEQWGEQPAGMFIYVKDADLTFKAAIDAGATVIMEPADQSYGRSGGVSDPFGNTWWITSDQK